MEVTLGSLVARAMASAWLVLCIVFGGSSGGGIVANGLLQIAAGGIVVALILRHVWWTLDRPARLLLAIVGTAAALALLSLVPLPPALWALFGGRGEIAAAYRLVGMPMPWLPISLAPDHTIAALLSLLPPVAMFLLVHASPPEGRRAAVITLAVMAFGSVLFGVTQQIAGYNSNTYIYEITSRGGAVGFFANRNHLATLCLMTMPFMAAFIAMARGRRDRVEPGRWIPPLSALLLLVVGALVVQSRAGWILLLPTSLACVLLVQRRRQGWQSRALVAGTAVVVLIAIVAALYAPVSAADLSVAGEVSPQERGTFMELTWQAIRQFWPTGTGWGSFTLVYPQFENPATVTSTYINHAHNDYLEFLLELGIGGAAITVAFLAWWGGRIRAAWRSGGEPIARAATVAIGVVLAHSFVDYPARTAAIACVVALCCGLASAPARAAEPSRRRARERTTGTIMLGAKSAPKQRSPHDPLAL